ncbi:MAG: hypothetical protein HJJLKODD_02713 [Phycisphaerae bacterium]|nr:hypothetical protein [Phycisphaerae bacterium]
MGTITIIEGDIFAGDVLQMAEAEAQEIVQTLAFERADPGFSVSIGIGGTDRGFDDFNTGLLQKTIKRGREFSIVVPKEKSGFESMVLELCQCILSLPSYPSGVGLIGGRTDEDSASAQMNEEQHIGHATAQGRDDAFGQKITGYQRIHVQSQKLPPGRFEVQVGP